MRQDTEIKTPTIKIMKIITQIEKATATKIKIKIPETPGQIEIIIISTDVRDSIPTEISVNTQIETIEIPIDILHPRIDNKIIAQITIKTLDTPTFKGVRNKVEPTVQAIQEINTIP